MILFEMLLELTCLALIDSETAMSAKLMRFPLVSLHSFGKNTFKVANIVSEIG